MRVLFALLLAAATLKPAVKLPAYTRQVLPNGAVLMVMQRSDVPLLTIRVVIKGGAESEPEQLSGIAALTAEGLRRGTAKRSADQFSIELDSLGAHFDTGADFQSSFISMEFLAKDLDAALNLLMDALMKPAFPEGEVKKMIAQRTDELKAMKDNPSSVIWQYYRSVYFGPRHPYGRPPDELSLSRIGRSDWSEYHKRLYAGANMVIAAVGDVDPAAVTPKLAGLFSWLPEGQAYVWKKTPAAAPEGTRIAIIDKPDATQTNFVVGQPGIQRNHPDRVPLWIVNTVFGGRFTSMLNDELRVNSGLTYGANSVFDQYHLPGRITISSFTKTETTAKAVDLALDVLKRLRDKGISAELLSSAKAYLKGTYPGQRLETSDQLAAVLAEIELFDLNRDEVDDLFRRIDAVTLQQANAVAKRYYNTDNLTFVLLGNAEKFVAEVKKYSGKVARTNIDKPGFRVAD